VAVGGLAQPEEEEGCYRTCIGNDFMRKVLLHRSINSPVHENTFNENE